MKPSMGCARLKNNCRLNSSFNFRKPWLNSDSNKELIFSLTQLMTQVAWLKCESAQIWLKRYISKNESTQPNSNVILSWLKIDSNVKKKLLSGGRKKSNQSGLKEAKGAHRGCKKTLLLTEVHICLNSLLKNNDNDKNVYKNTNESHIFLCGNKWQFNFWTSYHLFSSRYDQEPLWSLYQDGGSQAHQATFLPVPQYIEMLMHLLECWLLTLALYKTS